MKTEKKSLWSRFRLPHALTLLFLIIVFMGIVSWILSWVGVIAGTANGEDIPVLGAGILDWFTSIPAGMFDAVWIIIFLFVLGGFINVVVKSQALEAVIGKISKYFHADYKEVPLELKKSSPVKYYGAQLVEGLRQTWIIIPLMLFFSFAGTSYGMAEESLAFYAIVIPMALAAGFDVYTGFLIIFVGAGVGVMGSTINPFSILTAADSADIKATAGAAWRWISWVVFTIVTTIFVMVYAARVKMNKNNSALKDLFEVHSKTFPAAKMGEAAPQLTKRRLATAIIFLLAFIVMVTAMLAYDHMQYDEKGNSLAWGETTTNFETNTFNGSASSYWWHNQKVSSNMVNFYKLKGGEYESQSWVVEWTFGYFYLGTLAAYFFLISLIITLINWRGETAYVETMVDGAKDMMGVAFAVGVARGISVILSATNMQLLFSNGISSAISSVQTGKNFLVPILSYILFIPLTFVIPSTSGLAAATFPVLGPAITDSQANLVSGTITAYAWGAGLANMVVPTYGVVIGALAVTKIPFEKFLKAIWKYLLLMFLVGLVMLVIGGLTIPADGTQGMF